MKKLMDKQVTITVGDIVYAIVVVMALTIVNIVWFEQFLSGNW